MDMPGISNSGPWLQRSISPALNNPLAQELSTVLRADGPFVCRLKGKLKKLSQKGKNWSDVRGGSARREE